MLLELSVSEFDPAEIDRLLDVRVSEFDPAVIDKLLEVSDRLPALDDSVTAEDVIDRLLLDDASVRPLALIVTDGPELLWNTAVLVKVAVPASSDETLQDPMLAAAIMPVPICADDVMMPVVARSEPTMLLAARIVLALTTPRFV